MALFSADPTSIASFRSNTNRNMAQQGDRPSLGYFGKRTCRSCATPQPTRGGSTKGGTFKCANCLGA